MDEFDKLRIASRYWLLGMAQGNPDYYTVLNAFQMAETFHDDRRKGGQPEFIHQLQIFSHLRTQHAHLLYPILVDILEASDFQIEVEDGDDGF